MKSDPLQATSATRLMRLWATCLASNLPQNTHTHTHTQKLRLKTGERQAEGGILHARTHTQTHTNTHTNKHTHKLRLQTGYRDRRKEALCTRARAHTNTQTHTQTHTQAETADRTDGCHLCSSRQPEAHSSNTLCVRICTFVPVKQVN
jgi:hypothetical protein